MTTLVWAILAGKAAMMVRARGVVRVPWAPVAERGTGKGVAAEIHVAKRGGAERLRRSQRMVTVKVPVQNRGWIVGQRRWRARDGRFE